MTCNSISKSNNYKHFLNYLCTVFSPLELDPNKTFFTNRTRIFKKIKSGFSLFH